MKELHVLVELDLAVPLNRVLHLQGIARLKQYRRVVDELTVQDRVDTHHVFVDLGLNLVRNVVIYGVTHILRQDILETFLIEEVIVENLY